MMKKVEMKGKIGKGGGYYFSSKEKKGWESVSKICGLSRISRELRKNSREFALVCIILTLELIFRAGFVGWVALYHHPTATA
jgi:hypothetical protein